MAETDSIFGILNFPQFYSAKSRQKFLLCCLKIYRIVQLHSNSFIFPAANDDFFHYHFLQLVQMEHLNIEHFTIKSTVPPFLFSQPKVSISIKLLIGQSKNLLIPTKMTIASYSKF